MHPSASRVFPHPAPIATALIAAGLVTIAAIPAVAVEPVYWRQRVFFIPYQAAEQGRLNAAAHKVQLLVNRDGGGPWTVLQEAEPQVRGFSYHAPAEGEYAFALQTRDRQGKLTPEVVAEPQLRVVVDTSPPAITLEASRDPAGRLILRYEVRDVALRGETLRLMAQVDGGPWQPLGSGPPDIAQPDRLVGQAAWKPPSTASRIQFRATIEDRAGNQGTAAADASLVGPLLGAAGPALGSPAGGLLAPPSAAAGPALVWPSADSPTASSTAPPGPAATAPPASGLGQGPGQPAASNAAAATGVTPWAQSPPSQNPYSTSPSPPFMSAAATTFPQVSAAGTAPLAPPSWSAPRTPAQLVGDSGPQAAPSAPPASSSPVFGSEPRPSSGASAAPPPGNPFAPPPLFGDPSPLSTLKPLPAPGGIPTSPWTAPSELPPATAAAEPRWVNALTFDVDYELETVGPWGVAKVELWATRDAGQTWVNMGADPDNRTPMRITAPAAGVYGFRLVVTAANGAPPPNPTAGERPELSIGVDLQEPQAELQAAELGQGNLADHLIIRWTASDENLDARPAALFFSLEPQGPWTTIATDLENNGQYAWRLPQQPPERLFLRLEVRDKAGNVAVKQSPAPVALNLPQPTGRLRSVRPVEAPEDPGRFRTAREPAEHADGPSAR